MEGASKGTTLPIRLRVCTWNVGNAPPPQNLAAWLGPLNQCDLLVVGVQESTYGKGEVGNMVKSQVGEKRVQTKTISSLQRALSTGHKLQFVKFARMKYCCVCNDGISGQGLRCSVCKLNLHDKCEKFIEVACSTAASAHTLQAKSTDTLPSIPPSSPKPKSPATEKRKSKWHDFASNKRFGWCEVCSGMVAPMRAHQCKCCRVVVHTSCTPMLVSTCKSTQTDVPGSPKPRAEHKFDPKTYYKPTSCDVCNRLLWGFRRQGQQCKKCGLNIHSSCSTWVTTECHTTLSDITPALQPESQDELPAEQQWYKHLEAYVGEEMVPLAAVQLVEIRLSLYARKNVVMLIDKLVTEKEATGVAGVVGNKGGCLICIEILGRQLCFVATHLAAHEGPKYLAARNDNIYEIIREIRLGGAGLDMHYECDHVFWLGDVNYRIDLSRTRKDTLDPTFHWISVKGMVDRKEYQELAQNDELQSMVQKNIVLTGFKEGPVTFPPTFKVERRKGIFYLNQRIPAYCDRILWHSLPAQEDEVVQTSYHSVESLDTSDHKPVYSTYNLFLSPPLHPKPKTPPSPTCDSPRLARSPASSSNLRSKDPPSSPNLRAKEPPTSPKSRSTDPPTSPPSHPSPNPPSSPVIGSRSGGGINSSSSPTLRSQTSASSLSANTQTEPPPSMRLEIVSLVVNLDPPSSTTTTSDDIVILGDEIRLEIPTGDSDEPPTIGNHTLLTPTPSITSIHSSSSSIEQTSQTSQSNTTSPRPIHRVPSGAQSPKMRHAGVGEGAGMEGELVTVEMAGKFVPRLQCRVAGGGGLQGAPMLPKPKTLQGGSLSLQWAMHEKEDSLLPIDCGPLDRPGLTKTTLVVVLNKLTWGQQHSCYAMAALSLAPLASIPPGTILRLGPVPLTKSSRARGTMTMEVCVPNQ